MVPGGWRRQRRSLAPHEAAAFPGPAILPEWGSPHIFVAMMMPDFDMQVKGTE
jgi:hypothetical protein